MPVCGVVILFHAILSVCNNISMDSPLLLGYVAKDKNNQLLPTYLALDKNTWISVIYFKLAGYYTNAWYCNLISRYSPLV